MVRWVRIAALGVMILAMIALGVVVGLFLVANGGWVAIEVPPWLRGVAGEGGIELWLPALLGGWLVAAIAVLVLLVWSMYYVWRRRQYESLVRKLERELAQLRNLPFENPAPLEDLPELPDRDAAEALAEASRGEDSDELER